MFYKALTAYLLISLFSCNDKPRVPISNTLEIALGENYSSYVETVNNSIQNNDTSYLLSLLRIDSLSGVSGYDHGWVLIQVMKHIGDENFSEAIRQLTQSEIKNLKSYFRVGMMGGGTENEKLLIQFSETLKSLGLSTSDLSTF